MLSSSPEPIIGTMPEVSRFFGISIRFYFNDHDPPHFHAIYGECEALIEIDTLSVLRGEPRAGRPPFPFLDLGRFRHTLFRDRDSQSSQHAALGSTIGRLYAIPSGWIYACATGR